MALRKYYEIALGQSFASAHFEPFVNGLDNGEVTIIQGKQEVKLTYEDIAHLYGTAYPQQSYRCNPETGFGEKIDNFATLNDEEREYMYSLYPELRPQPESGDQMATLEGALSGVLSAGN